MSRVLKKSFGVLALVIGVSVLVWFVYNQFAPTPEFRRSFVGFFQLAAPVVMIWIGWRWLTAKPIEQTQHYAHFVFAKIMDPIGAVDRGRKYADPLQEALEERGLGEVSGGGTEVTDDGRVAWVGIDIELADLQGALEFTRQRLRELGAPLGSVLEYRVGDKNVVKPIGET
jgi:hypothetical protein